MINPITLRPGDVVILRKHKKATDPEPWLGKITSASPTKVTIDWIIEEDFMWKISEKYDICPRKDVIGKVKSWSGEGLMPLALETQIEQIYNSK